MAKDKKRVIKAVALVFALLAALIIVVMVGVSKMKKAYADAEQKTYDSLYQTAYNYAEAKNHVANYGVINIEASKEVSRLEVLCVGDTEFVIHEPDEEQKIRSWLEVMGTGIFTVELAEGEFIADAERRYVLVKVPEPVLTECAIEGTGKQYWKNEAFFSNGSVAEGVKLSQSQMKEGKKLIEDAIKQNRKFHQAARDSAIMMIDELVKKWNPEFEDLQVEVRFY